MTEKTTLIVIDKPLPSNPDFESLFSIPLGLSAFIKLDCMIRPCASTWLESKAAITFLGKLAWFEIDTLFIPSDALEHDQLGLFKQDIWAEMTVTLYDESSDITTQYDHQLRLPDLL